MAELTPPGPISVDFQERKRIEPAKNNRDEIVRCLRLLLEPGQVTELRILNARERSWRSPHIVSGYFDSEHLEALAAAVLDVDDFSGAYFLPQPIDPALLARASNRARGCSKKDPTTQDNHIIRRRYLLIDVDSERPSGISATEEERQASLDMADVIVAHLSAEGWPGPIVASSGNGAHLLYSIDLPNDPASMELVQKCLLALDALFSDDKVHVDKVNYNAARIWKLYGSVARKGDSTPDRPHRVASILHVPARRVDVRPELLAALAAKAPELERRRKTHAPSSSRASEFDLRRWIIENGLDVGDERPWKDGGAKWTFNVCPFNGDHTDKSAYIGEHPSGAISAGCHHNGCSWDWRELRERFEPQRYDRPVLEPAPPRKRTVAPKSRDLRPTPPPNPDDAEWIQANDRQLSELMDESWAVLHAANDPPSLFVRDGILMRLEQPGDPTKIGAMPQLKNVTAKWMLARLARIARWMKVTSRSEKDCLPPKDLPGVLVEAPDPELPELESIVGAPIYDRRGNMVAAPGYNAKSHLWYHQPPGFTMPDVKEAPTKEEAAASARFILDEVLGEFPFCGDGDRAHALCGLILPFVRRLIDGATPLHLVEAATPSSGKTFLTLVANILIEGGEGQSSAILPRDDEENEKKLVAKLLRSPSIVRFDNLKPKAFDSAVLAQVITTPFNGTWEGRLLGQSRTVQLPVHAALWATGNNPELSTEVARRCVRIRLNPKMERPERRVFKRDLKAWVSTNRGLLIGHIFTMVQHWLSVGRPEASSSVNGFKEWADVAGGIIEAAGVEGLLTNQDEMYDMADETTSMWVAFVTYWHRNFGSQWKTAKQLWELAVPPEEAKSAESYLANVLTARTPAGQRRQMGKALVTMRDRVFDGWSIEALKSKSTKIWEFRLAAVDGSTPDEVEVKEEPVDTGWL